MMEKMKRVVAYIRVSTKKEEQIASLEYQREIIERFCKEKGYELIFVYCDEGISASNTKKSRQAFMKMIEDSRNNHFDVVVIKDISRFSRNVRVALNAIHDLAENGVTLHFLNDDKEISNKAGLDFILRAAIAQEESAKTSERIKGTKRLNAEKGRVPARLYGYDRVDNFTLAVNEAEADVVRKIFHHYVYDGWGCRKLVLWLRASMIPTKGYSSEKKPGKPEYWNSKTVRRMLVNPVYKGVLQTLKSTSDFDASKKILFDPNKWLNHDRPDWAIVDSAIWDRAQEIVKERQEQYQNEKPAGRYSNAHLFSNLLFCETCGRGYGFKSYKYTTERRYYICTNYNNHGKTACCNTTAVNEDDLAEFVNGYFKKVLAGGRELFIEGVITDFIRKHNPDTAEAEEKKLRKTLREVSERKEKYKSMYLHGVIDIDELQSKTHELDGSLNDMEKKLFYFQRLKSQRNSMRDVIGGILANMDKVIQADNMTNAMLREVLEKVTVSKDGEVTVYPLGLAN